MSKELLLVIETVANEKDISKDMLFEAVEEALSIAVKKRFENDAHINVRIDRKTGSYNIYRKWEIINKNHNIENHAYQLYSDIAEKKGYKIKTGELVEERIKSITFGRIEVMAAKQVILQKVRDEEHRLIIKKFEKKIGKITYGEVKHTSRDFIILDLGNSAEGILYRKDLIPKEHYRLNDKLRVCILKIDQDTNKGSHIILTRAHKNMLHALLILEVPEIAEEVMDIVNIARDSGSRSKVSVKSNDKRVDPVGACVGIRGSRIQAITNELQGERIDIVLWDENPAQYVINAISPAEVISIIQDEDNKVMQVAVRSDHLSQAIGRNGQNVRLASALTGWHIIVMSELDAQKQKKKEWKKVIQLFIDTLDIDEDMAEVLVDEGFTTLEQIAYSQQSTMFCIEKFDKDHIEELQERAKTALISKAFSNKKSEEDLLFMKGITYEWAQALARNSITNISDLAELSVEDLRDIIAVNNEQAASLIMTARAPWLEKNRD